MKAKFIINVSLNVRDDMTPEQVEELKLDTVGEDFIEKYEDLIDCDPSKKRIRFRIDFDIHDLHESLIMVGDYINLDSFDLSSDDHDMDPFKVINITHLHTGLRIIELEDTFFGSYDPQELIDKMEELRGFDPQLWFNEPDY